MRKLVGIFLLGMCVLLSGCSFFCSLDLDGKKTVTIMDVKMNIRQCTYEDNNKLIFKLYVGNESSFSKTIKFSNAIVEGPGVATVDLDVYELYLYYDHYDYVYFEIEIQDDYSFEEYTLYFDVNNTTMNVALK